MKKPSERLKIEIKGNTRAFTDKITNLNSQVGSEVLLLYIHLKYIDVQGKEYYVVCSSFSQSKQPISSGNKNGKSSKNVFYCLKRTESKISRNVKVQGRRRIHNTAFICGKGLGHYRRWVQFFLCLVDFTFDLKKLLVYVIQKYQIESQLFR